MLLQGALMVQALSAAALAVGTTHIVVAGSNGVVQVYRTRNFQHELTIPRSSTLNAEGTESDARTPSTDAVAVAMPPSESQVVVLYQDRSMCCWNIQNKGCVTLQWSKAAHTSCIWALAVHTTATDTVTMATAAEGGSVQLWSRGHKATGRPSLGKTSHSGEDWTLPSGAIQLNPSTGPLLSAQKHRSGDLQVERSLSLQASAVPRALAFSACGNRLAVGDSNGSVHIYCTSSCMAVATRAAHDGLVRCLTFSSPTGSGVSLLASAGDDGFVHIFDATKDEYTMLQTLSEHEGIGVTASLFVANGLGFVTAAQDKSIVFRCAP
jgi:WD40 repeat protein